MTPQDLGKFEPQRRYATLVAVVLEADMQPSIRPAAKLAVTSKR